MPSSSMELVYFHSRCRGDLPRSLMIDAGLEFKETRITRYNEWPSRKPEFVFGQLPVLKVGDTSQQVVIAQSHAIARYIVKLTNPSLLGDTAEEAANIDMWYYQADDTFMELVLPFYSAPDTVDKLFKDNWLSWTAPYEKVLSTGKEYLANNKLSLADYHFFDVTELMLHHTPELLDLTPGVKAHHDRFAARPGIAKFREYVKGLPFTNSGKF